MRPREGYRSLSSSVCYAQDLVATFQLTFKVEENVRLIVFEHLGDQLNIHVVDIDFLFDVSDNPWMLLTKPTHLQAFIQHHDGLVEFLLFYVNTSDLSDLYVSTNHVGDDSGEQNILLVFVRAFLCEVRKSDGSIFCKHHIPCLLNDDLCVYVLRSSAQGSDVSCPTSGVDGRCSGTSPRTETAIDCVILALDIHPKSGQYMRKPTTTTPSRPRSKNSYRQPLLTLEALCSLAASTCPPT